MVKLKTPKLIKAKRAVLKFLRDNNLSPFKDYTNHPKYGEQFKELVLQLNIERDKVLTKYPQTDIKGFKKYQKMKKEKKDKKVAAKVAEVKVEAKAPKKDNKEKKAPVANKKYDYPLIDGREMTSTEKKKYRAEQRKLAKGDDPKPEKKKKEKVEDTEAKAPKKDKKEKKDKVAKADKKKKAKKEED